MGKDERGFQHSPFPCFSGLMGIACFLASPHSLSGRKEPEDGQMWAEGLELLGLFVPLPQGLSETDLLVPGKLYVATTSSLFISWLRQALSLLKSEVLVKMQKHTFYYDLRFFREDPS